MSFSVVRVSIALSVTLVGAAGLVGCSGGFSSAQVTASPGSVPQVGQVVATTDLSSGGHDASRCGGVDDAARDALKATAYQRGWVIDRFSADGQGCWESAGMTIQGQIVGLVVDVDQESATASLRVKDVTPSSTSSDPGAERSSQS